MRAKWAMYGLVSTAMFAGCTAHHPASLTRLNSNVLPDGANPSAVQAPQVAQGSPTSVLKRGEINDPNVRQVGGTRANGSPNLALPSDESSSGPALSMQGHAPLTGNNLFNNPNRPNIDVAADLTPPPPALQSSSVQTVLKSPLPGQPPAMASQLPSSSHYSSGESNSTLDTQKRVENVLQLLRQNNPQEVPNFVRAVRDASAAGTLDDVLAAWSVTAMLPSVPATTPMDATVAAPPSNSGGNPYAGYQQEPHYGDRGPAISGVGTAPNSPHWNTDKPQSFPAESAANSTEPKIHELSHSLAPRSSQDPRRMGFVDQRDPTVRRTSATTVQETPLDDSTIDHQLRQIALVYEERDPGTGEEQIRSQVYQRLLYAMSGDQRRAAKPMFGVDSIDRQFWQSQLWAMLHYFDENQPSPEARAAETIVSLEEAIDALRPRADLRMSSPLFCQKVQNYGNYEQFSKFEFAAGQPVVVYWEVENFASQESPEGFRTKMEAVLEIYDNRGTVVERIERQFTDDVCRRRRRDYFNTILLRLPKNLGSGEYTLKVSLRDNLANRMAEKIQKFTVK